MSGDDEVLIEGRLRDSISAAVARIDQRVTALEKELKDLGRTGLKAGAEMGAGMDKAAEGADNAGGASRRARPPVKELGNEAAKTGVKARAGAGGLNSFAREAKKAGASSRGSGRLIFRAFAFAGLVTGAFALAGGLSAIGAGGAIAVGGIAPIVGVLAALPGLFLAVKLSTLAFKLAGEQLTPTLDRVKQQFTDLGPMIAGGGLASGLDALADSTLGLAQATGIGLRGFGAEIGEVARETGRWVRSEPALAQIQAIFEGLRPVVGYLARGVLMLVQAFLNVTQAALPLTQEVGRSFLWVAQGLRAWTAQNLANGRATAWLMKSWQLFIGVVEVVWDFLVGVINIFRIAGGYATDFGTRIADTAREFRRWTDSAEGQARINQYFRDALPALREMGALLGMVVRGFAGMAANQNVAPLLAQIRTEFAPALGELVAKLSGEGGLGPALISAASALVRLFAQLDFSGLTTFIVAVGQLAAAITWVATTVPGANLVISGLLASMLGFKLLGPVFSIVGKGAEAFLWMRTAAAATENLTGKQKAFQFVLGGLSKGLGFLGTAFKAMALAGMGALRALSVALVTTPIGWVILAIMAVIAVVILLWTKCEWFRDAVTTAWEWIKNAAVVSWNWIKETVSTVIDAVAGFVSGLVSGVVSGWRWVADTASSVWSSIVGFVQGAVSVIAGIAMWLWTNAIQPVWNFIAAAWEIQWNIVKFVIQTVIFIIAAIITGLAKLFESVWNDISMKARYAFENVILPVINFFRSTWESITSWASEKWNWLTTTMSIAWDLFYSTYIEPVVTAFRTAWEDLSNWANEKWTWLTTTMSIAWDLFYSTYIEPVISAFGTAWDAVTGFASDLWTTFTAGISSEWNQFKDLVGGVIDWISTKWNEFTSWLGEVFAPVGDALSKIWTGIQDGASKAAGIVKGAWDAVVGAIKGVWNFIAGGWNDIPSVTVPDWVPGIGGKTFSLPKLPTLWHGGEAPGGKALVGEHGPEPLVRGGRVVGMVGAAGPEITDIPRGGYVVPNLSTLSALPGLTKTLPAGVAAAVARSVPGYADALKSGGQGRGDGGLRRAVEKLADAVGGQAPPVHLHGADLTVDDVAEAWRRFDRERRLRRRYDYSAGQG